MSEGTNKFLHASKMTRNDSYKLLLSSHLQEMKQCSTQCCQTVAARIKGFSHPVPISDSNQNKSHTSSYSDGFWEFQFLPFSNKIWVPGGPPPAWCSISGPLCPDPGWLWLLSPVEQSRLQLPHSSWSWTFVPGEGFHSLPGHLSMFSCPCRRGLLWYLWQNFCLLSTKWPFLFRMHC